MLPKLSDRAAMRCTSHIRRHYPDWLQAKILHEGCEAEQVKMNAFIADCKEHLSGLRNAIAEGQTPCIDRNWPMPRPVNAAVNTNSSFVAADFAGTQSQFEAMMARKPEPQIIEKVVEVKDPETEAKLEQALEALAKAEAVQHKLDAREVEAKPEEPPAEISDLFESDAYGMEAERLFKLHTDLTSKIVGNMPVSDAERALHSRLTPHVPWLKSRGAVEVL